MIATVGLVYYAITRSKITKIENANILLSGEIKLRKAFEKIEANGSKEFEQMQMIRGKIVNWEEKQRAK